MQKQESYSGWQKRIAVFLASQNVSLFGSSVVSFAITWYITLETSSGVWMMLSTICSMLPQVLISLMGGVWADRYNRKHLIMLADGFIALATLALAIAFLMGYQRLELLLAASVIRSIGAGIQTPAVSAIYPQLVPEESLMKVQGVNQTLNSVLLLASPAVGGLVLGTVGIVGAFFVDVVTAVLAIFVMSFIRVPAAEKPKEQGSVWDELKTGVRYTFNHRQLRRIVIFYSISFFLFTPAAVLNPLMVERSYGSEIWRLTANEVIWTVGSLLGGVFVALRGEFKNKTRTVAICLVGFGVTFGLMGISRDFIIYLIFMGLAGCFMPVIATAMTVHIQQLTAPEVMGRVFSVVQLISSSAMPLAILIFGPLADVVKVELLLIFTSVILIFVGILYGRPMKESGGERQPE